MMKTGIYLICAAALLSGCATPQAKPAATASESASAAPVEAKPEAPVIAGGYSPADEADPSVKPARQLAIDQVYKVYPSTLPIASITSEVQVVAGTNYRFLITMSGGEGFKNVYDVVVFRDLEGVMKVTSLKRVGS